VGAGRTWAVHEGADEGAAQIVDLQPQIGGLGEVEGESGAGVAGVGEGGGEDGGKG